jgi:hypothetical protein
MKRVLFLLSFIFSVNTFAGTVFLLGDEVNSDRHISHVSILGVETKLDFQVVIQTTNKKFGKDEVTKTFYIAGDLLKRSNVDAVTFAQALLQPNVELGCEIGKTTNTCGNFSIFFRSPIK